MRSDPTPSATEPVSSDDAFRRRVGVSFDALLEAVQDSPLGRAFLEEYARRCWTERDHVLLSAIRAVQSDLGELDHRLAFLAAGQSESRILIEEPRTFAGPGPQEPSGPGQTEGAGPLQPDQGAPVRDFFMMDDDQICDSSKLVVEAGTGSQNPPDRPSQAAIEESLDRQVAFLSVASRAMLRVTAVPSVGYGRTGTDA